MSVSANFGIFFVRVLVRVRHFKLFHVRVLVRVRAFIFYDVRDLGCPCPPNSGNDLYIHVCHIFINRIRSLEFPNSSFGTGIGNDTMVLFRLRTLMMSVTF